MPPLPLLPCVHISAFGLSVNHSPGSHERTYEMGLCCRGATAAERFGCRSRRTHDLQTDNKLDPGHGGGMVLVIAVGRNTEDFHHDSAFLGPPFFDATEDVVTGVRGLGKQP